MKKFNPFSSDGFSERLVLENESPDGFGGNGGLVLDPFAIFGTVGLVGVDRNRLTGHLGLENLLIARDVDCHDHQGLAVRAAVGGIPEHLAGGNRKEMAIVLH